MRDMLTAGCLKTPHKRTVRHQIISRDAKLRKSMSQKSVKAGELENSYDSVI